MKALLVIALVAGLAVPIASAQESVGTPEEIPVNTYALEYDDSSGKQWIFCTGEKAYINEFGRYTAREVTNFLGTNQYVVCFVEHSEGTSTLSPDVVEFIYKGLVIPVEPMNVKFLNGSALATLRPGVVYEWAYPLPDIPVGERFLMYVSGNEHPTAIEIGNNSSNFADTDTHTATVTESEVVAAVPENSTDVVPTDKFDLTNQPVLGQPDAPVEIIVVEDFKCPACQFFEAEVMPQIKRELIDTGQARIYFLNFPFIGPDSTTAAIAGECVFNQSELAFWKYKTLVFRAQGLESEEWATPTFLANIARNNLPHVNADALQSCIEDETYADAVLKDREMGNAAGVQGTPSIYVDGELLETFEFTVIRKAVQEVTASAISGTDFLLNRYGEEIYEICDFEYRDYALSVSEIDVRQPYCIFYEQNYDEVYNDLNNVFYAQLGKAFKDAGGWRFTRLEDGTDLSVGLYTNMDDTEGEVHLFSRGQGTYMVILQSY